MAIESSSIWKAPFFQLRDKMGFDVILSNPYVNRLIAQSKKKTDKIDAKILADLDRCRYLVSCHIPSKKAMENRDLTRHRLTLVRQRTSLMNSIHGILLQNAILPKGRSFSISWIAEIRKLGDYRIDSYLTLIDTTTSRIRAADARIREAVRNDVDAQFLKTIPGVGDYIALVASAAVDGIDRFPSSDKLCAYAGIVPSVRASADSVSYGHITYHGSGMLRWALVQGVRIHTWNCPKSDLTVFYKRLAKKRGHGIATIAAASKMLKMMYWMLRENRIFVQNYSQGVSCGNDVGRESRVCNYGDP